MSKCFIFSNSFTTRTVLFGMEFLFDATISEVLLLKENHIQDESFSFNNNVKIKLHKSIDECICLCDFVLIIKNENTPENSINYILCKSKELNKRCFEISNPWKKELTHNTNDSHFENFSFNKCSVILSVSLGVGAQQYGVEMLLNKIFIENNVRFKQFFSKETEDFFVQLDSCGILNENFSRQLNSSENQQDVIIYSVNIGENIYNIKKHIDTLRRVVSDFTILQTDIKFDEYKTAKNIIEYGCFSKLNMLIKSHYNTVDDKLLVYCDKKIEEDSLIQDIESIFLKEKLSFEIFSKIAFPEGIVKL